MKRSRTQNDGAPSPGSDATDSGGKRRKQESFAPREIQLTDGYETVVVDVHT